MIYETTSIFEKNLISQGIAEVVIFLSELELRDLLFGQEILFLFLGSHFLDSLASF